MARVGIRTCIAITILFGAACSALVDTSANFEDLGDDGQSTQSQAGESSGVESSAGQGGAENAVNGGPGASGSSGMADRATGGDGNQSAGAPDESNSSGQAGDGAKGEGGTADSGSEQGGASAGPDSDVGLGGPCNSDDNCSSGLCVQDVCAECEPDDRECAGGVPRRCSASGQWEDSPSCSGETPVCYAGKCVACEPLSVSCRSNAPATCAEDGSGWELEDECSGDTPACIAMTAGCSSCVEDEKQCDGDAVVTCGADGSWGSAEACPAGATQCVGNGVCQACDPDEGGGISCAGNTPRVCADGQWVDQAPCDGETPYCQPATGECTCTPNASRTCGECADGTQTCSANGTWGGCNGGTSPRRYYRDQDGDGYGDENATQIACSAPLGYVEDNTDCCDGDANANPGQTQPFPGPRMNCGGYDYDCDDREERTLTDVSSGCEENVCPSPGGCGPGFCGITGPRGWADGAPACGDSGTWNYCDCTHGADADRPQECL